MYDFDFRIGIGVDDEVDDAGLNDVVLGGEGERGSKHDKLLDTDD